MNVGQRKRSAPGRRGQSRDRDRVRGRDRSRGPSRDRDGDRGRGPSRDRGGDRDRSPDWGRSHLWVVLLALAALLAAPGLLSPFAGGTAHAQQQDDPESGQRPTGDALGDASSATGAASATSAAADTAGTSFTPDAPAVGSLASNPPGRYLQIKGPVSVVGTAPLPMEDLPIGEYKLFASGPGLPSVRGRFVRSDTGLYTLGWAGPTAIIYPPGLTHMLRGEWIRGGTMFAAGAGAAIMTGLFHAEMKDAEDETAAALATYQRAVSEDAIRAARLDVLAASQREEDEKELRNLWGGLFAASWVASSVEAFLLTPEPRLSVNDPGSGQFLATLPAAGGLEAAFRSALVPGAGQRYMGADTRGNFFFTLTAAAAAGAILAHDEFLSARRDQSDAQRRFDAADTEDEIEATRAVLEEAAGEVDEKQTLRWALLGAAAGVHLWNVLDAFGLGDRYDLPELTMSPTPETEGFAVGASWSIP